MTVSNIHVAQDDYYSNPDLDLSTDLAAFIDPWDRITRLQKWLGEDLEKIKQLEAENIALREIVLLCNCGATESQRNAIKCHNRKA